MGLGFEEEQVNNTEDVLAPVLDSFVKYRDEIRICAKNQDFKGIFKASDHLRDEELIHHGIRLEDK
jgi:hypothetical protein